MKKGDEEQREGRASNENRLLPGCGLSLLLHVLFQGLLALAIMPFFDWAYSIGLFSRPRLSLEPLYVPIGFFATQLLYMLPAAYIAKRRGQLHLSRNLAFQAGVVFLLGGACNGLLILG